MPESAASAKSDTPRRILFRELEKRSVFTDLSVFDTDYIPERIFVRKEFDPIIRFYFEALKSSLQQTMIVVGPSGSGKTLACRYYASEALGYAEKQRVPLASAYGNCRGTTAPYVLWQDLLRQFDAPAPKGLSVTDLIVKLAEAVSGRRHVIIILDELEKLFANLGSERANDILYGLARLRANQDLDTAISTIFISNNVHLPDMFDGPVRSSLNATNLAIGPYDAQELAGILVGRARAGLKEGVWSRPVIDYVAAKTAQHNSDARFAIKLLRNAASWLEAGGGRKLRVQHAEEAFEKTRREMEVEVLRRLSVNQLLVLLSLAEKAHTGGGRLVGLHEAYSGAYPTVCTRHSWKPLVYSQFLHTVGVLQSCDLLRNILERRRIGGYVRLAEINFTPADVIRVAQARLGA